MRNFFSSTKFKIILTVCVSLLIGIFLAAVSDNGSSPLSTALGFIMRPLNNAAAETAEMINDFNGHFVSSGKYSEKIDELNSEIDELKLQLVDYENIRYKLEAYEEFLDVKEKNPDYSFVPASVIMRDESDIYGSFTLNCGSSDGIKVNDPVIFGHDLVGVVRETTNTTCTVFTLFNPSISVGAYEIRTREDCYAESDTALTAKGMLKLSGLSRSTPVVTGGIICTSGISGIYPRDLIIGTVTEIVDDATSVSAYAIVKPAADPSVLTDVFVITDFTGKADYR